MEEVNNLCQEPFLDEEDREELQQKLNDLRTNWGEVRTEALQKETKWVPRTVRMRWVADLRCPFDCGRTLVCFLSNLLQTWQAN